MTDQTQEYEQLVASETASFAATGAFVTDSRYASFARQALTVALMAHVLFAVLFLILGVSTMVWVNLASIAIYAVCIDLFHRHKTNLINWLVMVELIGHSAIASWILGGTSGFQFYAWTLIPLAATYTKASARTKMWRVALISALCLGTELWLQATPALITLPASTLRFLHTFNLTAYLAVMAVLSFVYANTVAQAEHRLHKHATTDALTGLRNRRRALELARDELARARRAGTPVSIIISDIDRFKNINDQHGHPFGDQVISGVAQCLRECVRREDHIARWGGEEFLVLLPGIDLQGAEAAAERMRIRVQQLGSESDTTPVAFTASFGVSEWRSLHGESFEQCVARADTALYAAKLAGRNRVSTSASPPIAEHLVAQVLDEHNMVTQAISASTIRRSESAGTDQPLQQNTG